MILQSILKKNTLISTSITIKKIEKERKKKRRRRHKETNKIFKNDGFDYGKPSLMGSSNSRLSSILSQNKNQTQSTLSDDIYQQTHAHNP